MSVSPRAFDVNSGWKLLRLVPEFKNKEETDFLGVVSRLVQTGLVYWDTGRKGYAVDSILRHWLTLYQNKVEENPKLEEL